MLSYAQIELKNNYFLIILQKQHKYGLFYAEISFDIKPEI